MNGLRKVILACGMSSQTWITMVVGGGSRDPIWQSVRSLADTRWGTGWWVRSPGQCVDCIWPTEFLCEADWERKGVEPNRALQHAAAYSGWGLDTVVGHVEDYAWFVWIFGRYDVLVFRKISCGWSPLIPYMFEANMPILWRGGS